MGKAYVGKGTLENSVIRLDEATGLPQGRVRVTVEAERPGDKQGSVFDISPAPDGGRPAGVLLAELRALRDEWDRNDEVDEQ